MKQRNEKYTGSISIKSMGKRVLALLLVISMSMSYMAPLASAAEEVSCGREAHAHTEGCYEQKRICTMPDAHVHTDACYELQEAYVCGQEETPDHTHEDSCRTAQQVLVCTLETAEDAHVHGQACYAEELICKLEEHQHTALCDTAQEQEEETQSTTAPEETTEPEATTAPEETTVPEDIAATENTTAPSIEALADVEPIKIWVDPTNGGNEFYKGLTVDYRELTPDEQGKVTFKLPTVDETGSPRDYKYKIRTWYDIATRVGYVPGAEVTTDKNMVFYADWEPVTYDVGRYQEGHMVEGIDTSEFVTVTMYDYNDIANLAGATLKESRATGADKEVWSANGFDTNPLTVHTWRDTKDSLEFPQDTPENSASTDAAAMFPGIINTGLFRYAAQHYFPAIDRGAAGVKKVGTANYLFQYGIDPNNRTMDKVVDPNPYFYFDSHSNGAAYNRSQGRFYLYDAPSMTSCIDAANQGSAGDYLPYNLAHGDGVVVIDHDGTGKGNANYEKLEDANYWYGMLVEINFYIPEVPGTEAGRLHNKSEGIDGQKNDMIFRFLGDDDVWVLVDGQMVLDMGGIHEPVGGEINFATGEAHTYDDNGIYDATLQSLQPGNHTIQMYYMERGGGMANCGVWFNLMARQSLKINKADPQDENAEMAGTVFTVYEDAACTTPCDELFSDAKMETPASSFTIDENGSTMLYGFLWDKDYYIKETTTPAGYEKYVPDRTIKINFGYDGTMKVNVTPQNTLPGYDGIVYTYVDDGSVGDDKHGEITVYNTKSTQDLRLRKYWYNEEGLRDTSKTDPVTVDIFRTTSKDTKLEALTAANLYKANVSIDEMVNNTLMKTIQNVEQYNTSGELYYYYAVEKTVEGYGTPVYLANGVITGGIITVANAPEGVNIEYHNPEFTLVKKNYANQTLTGAAFDLYEYVSTTGKYLKLGSYTTDSSGSIVLKDILKYNTAYYLKETQAPEGYAIRDKLYYFGIRHGDTEMYPEGYPYGFNSWVEKDSNDQYSGTFYNAKLYVTKEWYDENHVLLEDALADELNPIEFELRLKTEYTPVETGKKTVRFDVNTWGASYSHSSKQLEPGTDVTIVLKQSTPESWAIVDPSLNINGTELAYEQEKSEANGVYSQKITIKLENVQDNIVISGDLKWDLSTWSAPEFTYTEPAAVTPPENKDELVATDSISANDDWIIGYNDVKVSGEETIDGVRYNVKYTYYVVEKEASIHTGFRYWECDNNNLDLANAQRQTITLKNDCKDPVFSDVTVKKVEKGSESTLLSGAQFVLTRYDNGSWLQIMQGTTKNGVLTLPRLSMDTLYRLEETKAPVGYEVETQYTYFWIKSTDTATVAMPEGISATAFGPGAGNYQLTIANPKTYVPEYVNISVTKVWYDSDDKAGFRPASVTVKLLADGADTGKSLTLNAANSWTGGFENLDKHKNNGKDEIRYTIEEVSVPGYTTAITGSAASGYTITNTYVPEQTEVSVNKVWEDADNQDGLRPAAITVKLLADGADTGKTLTLNAANNWAGKFEGLDKHKGGKEIVYTVEEGSVPGYTTDISGDAASGYIITNNYTPGTISVPVEKKWNDANNQDGKRPASITVTLLVNGEETNRTLVLSEANKWKGSFEKLDKYAGGELLTYTVKEEPVADYTTAVSGDAASGYTITNSYTPEKTQFSVIKDWDDANNQDGKRPAAVTVNLLANGKVVSTAELVADNGWTHTFADLDVYENGQKIIYTVQESVVPDGYTAKVDGHTITNTHVPEKLSIPVEKIWNDASNQDGKRPASVTVKLLANGSDAGKTLVLNEGNAWKGTFTDLPKFAAGVPIVYTVEEISVERYTTEITGDVSGFTITNTHTPELTQLRVNKIWKDADDQDGKRPYAVVITLRVNGQATNKTVTLNSSNNWTGQWSDLPKYSQGMLVEYNAVETGYYQTKADFDNNTNLIGKVPEDYTVTHGEVTYADGIYSVSVTNTYDPETVGLNVQKAWEDDDDRDGIRPDTITVTLQKKVNGGSWITVLDESGRPVTRTLTADTKWEADFVKLPKYEDGNEITYSVAEIAVPGYEVTYSLDNKLKVVTVTNTHTPAQTEVPVIKVWEDADNQDGKRPASVTVNLLANGSKVDTVTLSEANQWKHTFKDLPLNAGGNAINYTVEEVKVDGYTSVVTGNAVNGYTLTNTHTPETVSIPVVKTWEDAQDQDGKRPDTITVKLLADGNVVGSAELTKAADWKHTFRDLPKYAAGKEIVYTVQEPEVPDGYTSEVAGYTIINTHEPETVDVPVVKVWVDEDNKNGVRPYAVVITLHINGMPSDQSLTLNDSNQWQGKWEDLPMYSHGQKITYSVVETGYYMTETEYESGALISKVPEDYTVTHSYNADEAGVYTATVTNTYDPQHTGLNVQKEWNDADNQDGIRPETVIVTLMQKIGSGEWTVVKDAEGNPVTRTLTEENKWEADFIGLPRYADEQEITYSVVETEVPGYEADYSLDESVKVVTVTNTHVPELIQIPVTKVWEDDNNQDGKRPDSITVNLLGDGKKVASAQLNEDNKWTHTFTNLPKNAGGKAIVYTVEEIAVANYLDEISGDAAEGFTIRNRLLELSVVKQWFDAAGNQVSELSGMQAVTFKLYQKARFTPVDGAPARADETTVLYTGTLSQENNWRYDRHDGLKTRERLTIGEYTYDVSYSYFAEETGIPAGYELIGIVNNNVDLFSTDNTVITIRNRPVPKQTTSLTITKVAKEDTDSKLPGAQFTLYKWDAKWVKVGMLTSDSDGKIEFTGLEFNTAYKLEESKAPVGYQKDGGPWYFFYEKADTATYPVSRPENDTDYTKNVSDKTAIQISNPEIPEDTSLELTVKKTWYAKNATKAGTAPSSISKITFKLYRKAVTTDGKTVKLNNNLVDTYTITKKDGWKLTITGLSAKGYEMVDGVKTEVKYTYYVEENKVDGYKVSYKGQNTANIEIRNTENPTDTTNPKTGDSSHIGLYLLTMLLSGTALVFTATRKRRRW